MVFKEKMEIDKNHSWLKNTINTGAFVCSFVSGDEQIGNALRFWQSYGKDGLGCSIQLPFKFAPAFLERVLYEDEKIKEFEESCKDHFNLGKQLHEKLPKEDRKNFVEKFWKELDLINFLYKSKDYEHEREYRCIITQLDSGIHYHFKSSGPYLREYILHENLRANKILVTGSKITIGPRVEGKEKLCQNLTRLAKAKRLPGPEFTPSNIPYRKVW